MTKKRTDQKRTRDVAVQQTATDSSIGYQITTLHGNAGTSRAYATLAGARRALASVPAILSGRIHRAAQGASDLTEHRKGEPSSRRGRESIWGLVAASGSPWVSQVSGGARQ